MTQASSQDGTGAPVTSTPATGASVTSVPIPWPPRSGPGSDKDVWMAFAREVTRGSEEAQEVVDEQATLIAHLEAEVAQMRARLAVSEFTEAEPDTLEPGTPEPADSKPADDTPRDTRRRMSEQTKAAIRADLAGGLSQSEAARRNGVSAMTVSRLVRSA